MTTYKGIKFQNQEVVLDGAEFINCAFINCLFHYSGGDCRFAGQNHFENPSVHFLGAAQNTLVVLQFLGFLQRTAERSHPPIQGPSGPLN